MLKANVGLNRKITRDYNSQGFAVNLEAEITASPNQPEAVLNQIAQLYRLAEEALNRQMDGEKGEQHLPGRDNRNGNGTTPPPPNNGGAGPSNGRPHQGNGNGQANGNGKGSPDDLATNKQVQFLLSLAKRHGLSKFELEKQFEEQFGKKLTVYQLTKKQAGQVIDELNQAAPSNAHR